MNVVGLGNAGCSIAKYFENYPQYNVFYVDVGLRQVRQVLRTNQERLSRGL